jgi:hypothetical protein
MPKRRPKTHDLDNYSSQARPPIRSAGSTIIEKKVEKQKRSHEPDLSFVIDSAPLNASLVSEVRTAIANRLERAL